MGNGTKSIHLVYQGPLGQIFCEGASFFASKDGFPLGTLKTYDEAMEMLAWKGRVKPSALSRAPGFPASGQSP
jgi:hypothetical protein